MAGGERMETDSAIVVPGDRIGSSSELQAGSGCYVAGDHLYASAVGVVEVSDVLPFLLDPHAFAPAPDPCLSKATMECGVERTHCTAVTVRKALGMPGWVESDGAAATKRASVLRLKGRHTPVLPTTDSIVIAKVRCPAAVIDNVTRHSASDACSGLSSPLSHAHAHA
eukprot:3152261-Rhodomonas_salina.3